MPQMNPSNWMYIFMMYSLFKFINFIILYYSNMMKNNFNINMININKKINLNYKW